MLLFFNLPVSTVHVECWHVFSSYSQGLGDTGGESQTRDGGS